MANDLIEILTKRQQRTFAYNNYSLMPVYDNVPNGFICKLVFIGESIPSIEIRFLEWDLIQPVIDNTIKQYYKEQEKKRLSQPIKKPRTNGFYELLEMGEFS